jgi:hypothetical protein
MPAAFGSRARPIERIASIVKMQSLLFESFVADEYEELLDFHADRRPVKIERVVSILRAQGLLLGSGAFLRGSRAERAAAEIPALVAYARSLLEADDDPRRKYEVMPRQLGRPFAARGWGLPLFGDCRPERPPERGLLLVYSSPDGEGRGGCLEAARLGPGDRLAYDGRALVLDSSGYWLSLSARASSAPEGAEAWGRGREIMAFSRYVLALDRKPRKKRFMGRLADPYESVYPYVFYDVPAAVPNLARFAGDILCGIFRVPLREAERVAEAFSGRLP